MTDARPIDIIVPSTEEDWIRRTYSNRGKSIKNQEGIEKPSIVVDHAWKTLPSGRQIMIRKGDPGALNGNDMRKINIAVEAASKNPSNATAIRDEIVKSYIPESERHQRQELWLLDGPDHWSRNPASAGAANMCVANNVMKGRDRHDGLSPDQLKAVQKSEKSYGEYPKESMLKAVNVQAVFNRNMAKEKFGDGEITVYRGIHGDQAKAIKARAKKGDAVRFDSNSLSSWTTNKEMAKNFSSRDKTGIVIKSKITYKNIHDSYASTTRLTSKQFAVDEVIASLRGTKITGVIVDG